MAYEIDYIPIDTREKGGDAIAIRYGDFSSPETQHVVVIDSGTKEMGAGCMRPECTKEFQVTTRSARAK